MPLNSRASITASVLAAPRFACLVVTMLTLVLGSWAAAPASAQAGATISDASASEAGSTGAGMMTFVVRVVRDTAVPAGQVSVQWQAASGTATITATQCGPGIDIVAQPGAVFIASNTSQGQIQVTVCEDALDELDAETFTVSLLSASGASITDGQATGTLFDDDPTPSLRVADVSVAEGNPGEQRNLTFTLSLSAASGRPVTVNYNAATAAGGNPATAGAACGGTTDFVSRAGNEVFPLNTTSRPVTVTLCGDALFEAGERIAMTLSAPTNATLDDANAVGTISNDDAQPMVTITPPNEGLVTEGSGAAHVVTVQVTLSNANHAGASVVLRRGGSAERGATCTGTVDILATDEVTVTWPANHNDARTVEFTVCSDTRDEENDTVEWNVVGGATAGVPPGEVLNRLVIFDDDPPPEIRVGDATVTEGSRAQVTVTLSAVSNREVDVLLSSGPGSPKGMVQAVSGATCSGTVDFEKTAHRIRVPAGELTAATPLRVTTCSNRDGAGDGLAGGASEVFLVTASDPTNATLGKAVGVVLIRDP